jgi:polyisoprenoid-binding protein YceI
MQPVSRTATTLALAAALALLGPLAMAEPPESTPVDGKLAEKTAPERPLSPRERLLQAGIKDEREFPEELLAPKRAIPRIPRNERTYMSPGTISLAPGDAGSAVEVKFQRWAVLHQGIPQNPTADTLKDARVEIAVDLSTVLANEAQLTQQLRSPEYLQAGKEPGALATVSGFAPVQGEPDSYTATARVELLGRQVEVPVRLSVSADRRVVARAQVSTSALGLAPLNNPADGSTLADTWDLELEADLNFTNEVRSAHRAEARSILASRFHQPMLEAKPVSGKVGE